jgi:hypothetical protein
MMRRLLNSDSMEDWKRPISYLFSPDTDNSPDDVVYFDESLFTRYYSEYLLLRVYVTRSK